MSHELDFETGKAGIAYVGATPWHGLGQIMIPSLPLTIWAQQAGLDWRCLQAGVQFDREDTSRGASPDHKVLYRSDTGGVLSIVGRGYQPVQPKEIIEFYADLTEKHGFKLETAGSLKGGRKIWALADAQRHFELRGKDVTKLYLLLATSFDGTMSTQCRWTAVRVVCNNTIELATMGRAEVVVPHSTQFNADAVKVQLEIGDAWTQYAETAKAMSERVVSKDETLRFLLNVYLGVETDDDIKDMAADEKLAAQAKKLTDRLTNALFNSPGAHLASAKGTLWGILNVITHDVDFSKPARSQENRLNSSWFGAGGATKQRALELARSMVA